MSEKVLPILYSFRRCPYAMRARLAIQASQNQVELREIILRDKPVSMLEASPKGTVPVLLLGDGSVLEESRDIISWSMENGCRGSEAESWANHLAIGKEAIISLIDENDTSFKAALDAYKYPDKFPESERDISRATGAEFIHKLNKMLEDQPYLFGETFSVADASILPFVRQYAHVDQDWFYDQTWSNVIKWLDAFKASERFEAIMPKFKRWEPDDAQTLFGGSLA